MVSLLGNEELLEEERVKAKNIREKMSSVVGGGAYSNSGYGSSNSGYSGYNGGNSGYGGNSSGGYSSKYDHHDKKKNESKPYDYGNSLGAYGDYSYNKSTLDKYKDAKNDKPATNEYKKEDKKPEVQAETKKPFEKVAGKLSKPGEKKEVEEVKPVQAPVAVSTPTPNNNTGSIIDIFEISTPAVTVQPTQPFSFEAPKPAVQPPQVQQVPQPQPVQTFQPQPVQTFQPAPTAPVAPIAPQTYAPQPQVAGYPNPYVQPQPQQSPQYPQQYGYNQYQQPNPYQQPQFNQFQQNPYSPQPNQFAYQQPYNPAPQPYNPYSAPPQASNAYSAGGSLGAGITLNPTSTKK